MRLNSGRGHRHDHVFDRGLVRLSSVQFRAAADATVGLLPNWSRFKTHSDRMELQSAAEPFSR